MQVSMGQIVSLFVTHVPRSGRLRLPMAASRVRGSMRWVYADPHPLAYSSIHELARQMYRDSR